MKKIIAIAWLIICLIPAGGNAEESVVTSEGWFKHLQFFPVNGDQFRRVTLPSEEKVRDEELLQIVGHGLDALPFSVADFPRRIETASSRIKLWDEADRGIVKIDFPKGPEVYQSITLPVAGNR
ncbi:MAG: hypothetical protein FD174_2363 [Geobacteraceae bacterium]|nr:MAG: hypothetical protein FD174_2363 [Geobacteraceae bacterium]